MWGALSLVLQEIYSQSRKLKVFKMLILGGLGWLMGSWCTRLTWKRRRDYHLGKIGLLSLCQLNLNQPDNSRRIEYKVPASSRFILVFLIEIY